MLQIISLGEALIDFVSLKTGVDVKDAPGFLKAAGGAPANVAAALGRLGVHVGFIGKVGDDPFGHFLKETLANNGVDTSQMLFEKNARTALAFVSLRPDGERSFSFYRHPSADMFLEPKEIDEDYISRARIFHFGSITLISEPSRSATLKAIEYASRHGLVISYDPNLRLNLWESPEQARREAKKALHLAHIVKVNERELKFLTDTENLLEGTKRLQQAGPLMVVVTLGKEGCFFCNKAGNLKVDGFCIDAIDTTGAGDAFVAALLFGLLNCLQEAEGLEQIPLEKIRMILQLANKAGAITATRKGAVPALPTLAQLKDDTFAKSPRR